MSITEAAEKDSIIAMALAIWRLNIPGTGCHLNLTPFGKPNCRVGIQAIPPDYEPVYRFVEEIPGTTQVRTLATSASEAIMAFYVRKHYQQAKV